MEISKQDVSGKISLAPPQARTLKDASKAQPEIDPDEIAQALGAEESRVHEPADPSGDSNPDKEMRRKMLLPRDPIA